MSDSTVDALDAIDNAIDEALGDEPTPPKRLRSNTDTVSVAVTVFNCPALLD